MAKAPYSASGQRDLDEAVFGEDSTALVHEVRAELNARRQGTAATQDARRGPRRRRQGVAPEGHRPRPRRRRSPQRDGGGIVFGPKPRHYVVKVNRKARRARCARALGARRARLARHRRPAFDTRRPSRPRSLETRVSGWDAVLLVADEGEAGVVVPQPRGRARHAGGRRRDRRHHRRRVDAHLGGRARPAHRARKARSGPPTEEAAA